MVTHILVADDSPAIQKVISLAFSPYHLQCYGVSSLNEALEWLKKMTFQIVIADTDLPGVYEPEDFICLKKAAPQTKWIFLEGAYHVADRKKFEKAGLDGVFLKKPFESGLLISKVVEDLGLSLSGEPVYEKTIPSRLLAPPQEPQPPSRILEGASQPYRKPFDVEGYIRDEIARLLPQAVEAYCQIHFPKIATQVIRKELDHLTGERARYELDP
jgi:CheY-like chemotaxis protein